MGCTAQTYFYKRVMVVENGRKVNKNDDAHYITFNKKGFYESDKNGYENGNSSFVDFIKDENGYHCYFGNGYYGANHYYFSSDFSRLNVRLDHNTTYVYQRTSSSGSTASKRKIHQKQSSSATSVAAIVTTTPVINSGSSSNSSVSSHSPLYKKCHVCNGTGRCQKCKGSGVSFVTGEINYVPCAGCSNANGNGKCYMCRGTGRI